MPQTDERSYSNPATRSSTAVAPSSASAQGSGNQAAVEAAGLAGGTAGGPEVEDSMIGGLLQDLVLGEAIVVALACPALPACSLFLESVGVADALRAAPAKVLGLLDEVFPNGTTLSVKLELEAALKFLLGCDWEYTLARVGDVLQLDALGTVSAGVGLDGESRPDTAGGPLFATVATLAAEQKLTGGERFTAGWNVPLDAALFISLFGPTTMDLLCAPATECRAKLQKMVEGLIELYTPDRFALGVVAAATGDALIETRAMPAGGGTDQVVPSLEAELAGEGNAGVMVGFDERSWYVEGMLGGTIATTTRVGAVEKVSALIGVSRELLATRLGGDLRLRIRGPREAIEEAQDPAAGLPSGVTFELTLETESGVRGLAVAGGAFVRSAEQYTFESAGELVAWATGRLSDAQEAGLLAADWSQPGGIPGNELPEVDYERSFSLEPTELGALAGGFPDAVGELEVKASLGFDVSAVTTLRLSGNVHVGAAAARKLVGPGASLPVVNGDPEATMVGLERRLADGALSAAAHGASSVVVDGRDVSMVADEIVLRDLELEAEFVVTEELAVGEAPKGLKAGIQGLISRKQDVAPLDAAVLLELLAG